MKNMIPFKRFFELCEALPYSKYRDIMKDAEVISYEVKENISKEYKTRYKDWFNGKWRVYIPMKSVTTEPIYQDIEEVLSKLHVPYTINGPNGWLTGNAKQKNGTRQQSISKLLQRENRLDLKKKFDERFKGAKEYTIEDDLTVVISRHPKDILEQTEDKEWHNRSCKRLSGGVNRHFIPTEINDGCLVAFCMHTADLYNKPKFTPLLDKAISRILVIPLVNENDEDDTCLHVPEQAYYKKFVVGFRKVVEDWVYEKQGFEPDLDEYCLDDERVYDNAYKDVKVLSNNNVKRLEELLVENDWTIETLNNETCHCYTYDLSLLDKLVPSQNGYNLSSYFRYIDIHNVNPELYRYNDDLQYLLIKKTNDYNKEKIIEKYKEAGGESDDWEEIVQELDIYLNFLTDGLSLWYEELRQIRFIEGIRDAIKSVTFTLKFGMFNIIELHSDRYKIEVYIDDSQFDTLCTFLEEPEIFADENMYNELFEEAMDNVIISTYELNDAIEDSI